MRFVRLMAAYVLSITLGISHGAIAQPVPPGTRVMQNVAYGQDPAQMLDVYLPAEAKNAPIIFMVHGGFWRAGDKKGVVQQKASYFLSKGYIFISTNYRLRDDVFPNAQAHDVAAAIQYTLHNAPEWGGDPNKLVVIGHSAGAHLAALLAANPSDFGLGPWRGTVALDSAAYDTEKLMAAPHRQFYDRAFGPDQSEWRAASPMAHLSAQATPLLLVCSTKRAVSCPEATLFAARAQALHIRAEVSPQNFSHMDISKELGNSSNYTDTVTQFIDSVLR